MATILSSAAPVDDAHRRYSGVAMVFHWTIAILVILNWQIAEAAGKLQGAEKAAVYGYHKAFGMLILALTLGRVAWRLAHPHPPIPMSHAMWERRLAQTVHVIFYVLLIGLPLGAWYANSLGGKAVDFFGLFTIPPLPVGPDKALSGQMFDLHATGATVLLLLIALHVLGVVKHLVIDRDGQLFRMLPFGRMGRRGD